MTRVEISADEWGLGNHRAVACELPYRCEVEHQAANVSSTAYGAAPLVTQTLTLAPSEIPAG